MATPEELKMFDDMLRLHVVDDSLTIEETIAKEKKFIKYLNVHLELHTNFINHLESIAGLSTMFHHAPFDSHTQQKAKDLLDTVEAEEKAKKKRIKRFLKKRFFKDFPYFEEVPERNGCDAILMLNEKDLINYNLYLNDDKNKEKITELQESGLFRLIFS